MPRRSEGLSAQTKENKIKRLQKHLKKRNHKTAKPCRLNDTHAIEALKRLGQVVELGVNNTVVFRAK